MRRRSFRHRTRDTRTTSDLRCTVPRPGFDLRSNRSTFTPVSAVSVIRGLPANSDFHPHPYPSHRTSYIDGPMPQFLHLGTLTSVCSRCNSFPSTRSRTVFHLQHPIATPRGAARSGSNRPASSTQQARSELRPPQAIASALVSPQGIRSRTPRDSPVRTPRTCRPPAPPLSVVCSAHHVPCGMSGELEPRPPYKLDSSGRRRDTCNAHSAREMGARAVIGSRAQCTGDGCTSSHKRRWQQDRGS